MDISRAEIARKLLAELEYLENMHEGVKKRPNAFWRLSVDNDCFKIPASAKKFYLDAIDKALEYYKSEIEKL